MFCEIPIVFKNFTLQNYLMQKYVKIHYTTGKYVSEMGNYVASQ